MKVAIFSDTHDNVPNLKKFFSWINDNNIEHVIFCGDLSTPAILRDVIVPNYQGRLYMVFGNVTDRENLSDLAAKYEKVRHFGDRGKIKIGKFNIGFVHYPDKAKEMAESGEFNYVFYGHSHKPWLEVVADCQLANPGTLAGLFNKATFAVFDAETGRLELKLLERL